MASRRPTFTALVLSLAMSSAALAQGAATPGGIAGGAVGGRGGAQRTPVRDRQATTPDGTGTIAGRVTSADGAPIRRAQVVLAGEQGNSRRTASTDGNGGYTFTQLPQGRYNIRATKGGYVDFSYGQRSLNAVGTPVTLADGESLSGINIVLPRGSAVSGRVTDEFGDPVLQAQVQALRYQYQADGERRLIPGGTQAMTDDLGQFRLYNLNPGEYVISATARNAVIVGPPRPEVDEPEEGYAPTFYPGTSNPAEAQAINVGLGQEFTVQIQLVPSRLSRITGFVFDSQGRPASQGTQLMLRPAASAGGPGMRPGNVTGDGAFTIAGVPPGDYVIEVRPRPVPRPPGDAGPAIDGEFALVLLNVGGGDISGLRIVTGRGTTLSGRVVFEGTPPAAGSRIRVVPQSAEPARTAQFATRSGPNDGVVASDGTFQLDGIAGPTFLRITFEAGRGGTAPPPAGRYMTKSVLVDGVDLADVPLDPSRRPTIGGITVVVTDKLTDISGMVTDTRGASPGSAAVLIVPEPLPAGVSPTRFVRLLQSDATGKFNVRGMPAGRYSVVALSAFDQAHQYDPDVIQRARQLGKSFSVREGESVTLDLKVTSDF